LVNEWLGILGLWEPDGLDQQ